MPYYKVRLMNFIIGKAKAADAAEILEYLKRVGGETDNLTFGAEGMPFTAQQEAEYISSLEASKDNVMLVAKCEGQIVGLASLSRLPRRMSHRGDLAISVIKSHWGKGVGSELMKNIIDFGRNNAFEIIELQVRCDNGAAIHLYEKFGFEKTAKHPDFFKIGNEYIDFEIMRLKLK